MEELLKKARDFAESAHGSQKYGEKPYVSHLDDVAEVATEYSAPFVVRLASFLHDTVEDTSVSVADIKVVFGGEVARLVDAVTKEPAPSRKDGLEKTLAKIRAGGSDAILLKLCDRIANVRRSAESNPRLLNMYREENVRFRAALYLPEHSLMWQELGSLFSGELGSLFAKKP